MSKKSNTSKRYTAEFKRDAVALALSSDKTVTEVARDLRVSPEGVNPLTPWRSFRRPTGVSTY
ncbi:transposase [Streptomyces sp. NBC_01007]|nr:transposase [Streptomyces sp. NBC_01007]